MAAWSIVQQRGLDVKKAQTNPSTDPNSSDQDHSWRGSSSSGPPCGLCFGFICRVFKQSVGESYLFHPINSSDYPHDSPVLEPS